MQTRTDTDTPLPAPSLFPLPEVPRLVSVIATVSGVPIGWTADDEVRATLPDGREVIGDLTARRDGRWIWAASVGVEDGAGVCASRELARAACSSWIRRHLAYSTDRIVGGVR